MADESDTSSFDRSRAELFDALGHPVRIRILHALEGGPLGFSELRRRVGLESSGHLEFHLGKLDGMVASDESGRYALTDDGNEALRVIDLQIQRYSPETRPETHRVTVSRGILAGLVVLMVLLALVAISQQMGLVPVSSPRSNPSLPFPLTTTDDVSALQLTATVSPIEINPIQKVTVVFDLYNPTSEGVRAAAGLLSGYADFPLSGCGPDNLLSSLSLYLGYFTEANISTATSVTPYPPYPPPEVCQLEPTGPVPQVSFTFYPHSDVAAVNDGGSIKLESIYEYVTITGLAAPSGSNATSVAFQNGAYTILVQDIFGHWAFAYFYVDSRVFALGD